MSETPTRPLDRLTDFLVEDIMETSDEQLIADAIEDGEDPEAIAEHGRKLIEAAIDSHSRKG